MGEHGAMSCTARVYVAGADNGGKIICLHLNWIVQYFLNIFS